MSVYKAIADVMGDLARIGIAKDQTNTFDNYKFRGIDAVYNTLATLLSKHGLLILPRVLERHSEERVSQKGGAIFYVTVKVEFDFVSAVDGSKHVVCAYGEAMDRGDKGTNKAMTAAYKYACFEAFCIPTEGTDDADAESHEVRSRIQDDLDAEDSVAARKTAHDDALERHSESIAYIKERLADGVYAEAAKEWALIPQPDQIALWLAPSKGGCLTTEERKSMRDKFPRKADAT